MNKTHALCVAELQIDCDFESGNIVVEGVAGLNAQVSLRTDTGHAKIKQWFYFRCKAPQGKETVVAVVNAHDATYPGE